MAEFSPLAAGVYDVNAAADYLKLTKSYLHNMRHNKKGPKFHKLGHRIYYKLSDLKAWNDARLTRKEARTKKPLKKAA